MGKYTSFIKRLQDVMRNDAGINGDAQRIEQLSWMLFLKVYDIKENDWMFDDLNYHSIIPEHLRWRNWAQDDKTGNVLTGDELLDFVNNDLFPSLKNIVVSPETPIKKSIVKTTFQDANQYMKDGVLLRQVINIIDEVDLSDSEDIHSFGEIYETILRDLQSAGNAGEFYTPRAVTQFMANRINPQIGERMADLACGTGGFLTSWINELRPKINSASDQRLFDESIFGIEKKQFPYMLCITNMLLNGIDTPKIKHDNSLIKDLLDYTEKEKFDVILMNPPFGGSEKKEIKQHFPSDLRSNETSDLFVALILYRLKKNGRAAIVLPDGFLTNSDSVKVELKKKILNDFNLHTIVKLPNSTFAPYATVSTNILFFDYTGPTSEIWIYNHEVPSGQKHYSKTKPIQYSEFDEEKEWWFNRKSSNKAWKITKKQVEENDYIIDFKNPLIKGEKDFSDPKEIIDNMIEDYNYVSELLNELKSEINTDD